MAKNDVMHPSKPKKDTLLLIYKYYIGLGLLLTPLFGLA